MMILKIGGGAAMNLAGVAADVAALSEPIVIVHGANALRDDLAVALGRETRVVTSASGYTSVHSDDAAIDLLMMAYAGLRNKRLVELLQQHDVNAIGLSGLDGRLVRGRRNRGIRVNEGGKLMVLHDLSGKPEAVNVELLTMLLDQGYVPVVTVPICDESGTAINSENDDVVAVMQRALRASRVIELIEAPGLLRDPGDPSSLIARLAPHEIGEWEARASGRMKRKLHALRALLGSSSPRVVIADGRGAHPLADALAGGGTLIAAEGAQEDAKWTA